MTQPSAGRGNPLAGQVAACGYCLAAGGCGAWAASTLCENRKGTTLMTKCAVSLVAGAMALVSLTGAVYDTLHESQKGFISKRVFEDHIRELNEDFYDAVESGNDSDNYFVLFMDTAKAFDSIAHAFIIAAIQRTGLLT